MTATFALIRKNLLDSRWMLGILGLSLFWLCWLFVYLTGRTELAMREFRGNGPMGQPRGVGSAQMDFSTAAIEMQFWVRQPLFYLIVSVWAISRGIGAVGGEIEKGTMDLILSRPIARWSYLTAQVGATTIGLALMGLAMVLGNQAGARFNTLETPPSAFLIAKAALNLMLVAWAIYGYTFVFSTADSVKWRPNLISGAATFAGFIALLVPSFPVPEFYKKADRLSVFRAFNPIEVVTKGETLAYNGGILLLVGGIGIFLGFLIFSRRDIPAGS